MHFLLQKIKVNWEQTVQFCKVPSKKSSYWLLAMKSHLVAKQGFALLGLLVSLTILMEPVALST